MSEMKKFETYSVIVTLFVLFSPYFVTIENLLGGSRIRILAPLWGLLLPSGSTPSFEIPFLYTIDNLAFWGSGLLCILVVYSATQNYEEVSPRVFLLRIFLVLVLQIAAYILIQMKSVSGPPINIIPLPIPVVVSILLIFPILKKRGKLGELNLFSTE